MTEKPETHLEKYSYYVSQRFQSMMQKTCSSHRYSGEASWFSRRPMLDSSGAILCPAEKEKWLQTDMKR